MAVKRKLYEKTTNGLVEQLIASSADIVEFNGGDNADLTGIDNAQDAIIKVAELANSGGESVQDIVDGKTKVGHAAKADKVVNKLKFTAYQTATSSSPDNLEYDGSAEVVFDRVAKAEQANRDGNNNIIANTYVPNTAKGVANGVATLDANGKVPTAQLPSYVDDVLEFANKAAFPAVGESGKIYVDLATNKTWRWGGTAYAEISASLALGTTTGTAYDGGSGQANATAIANIIDGTQPVGKVANRLTIRTATASSDTTEDVEFDGSAPIAIGTSSNNMVYSAKRAQCDSNGKDIDQTYAKKEALTDGTITVQKAEKLSASKEISLTGDVTGSVSTDFSSNPNIATTLADSGVEVGTYSTVVVDAKGRVTSGYQVVEFGGDNQDSPHASLVVGGLFFKKL